MSVQDKELSYRKTTDLTVVVVFLPGCTVHTVPHLVLADSLTRATRVCCVLTSSLSRYFIDGKHLVKLNLTNESSTGSVDNV